MRIARWAALGAVALMLSGCGAKAPDPAPAPAPASAQPQAQPIAGLGDPTTLDFCSFVDQESLRAKGLKPGSPAYSFDSCRIPLVVEEVPTVLTVGSIRPRGTTELEPIAGMTLPPGLSAARQKRIDEFRCYHYLGFGEDNWLQMVVRYDPPSDLTVPGPLCDATRAALDGVVASVTAGKVAHTEYPPNSLGRADACALLTDDALTKLLGSPAAKEALSPTKHSCSWRTQDLNRSVALQYLADVQRPGASVVQIAGRDTTLSGSGPHSVSCVVQSARGPAPFARNGELETVRMTVGGSREDDWCKLATAVAQEAWPKIPPQ